MPWLQQTAVRGGRNRGINRPTQANGPAGDGSSSGGGRRAQAMTTGARKKKKKEGAIGGRSGIGVEDWCKRRALVVVWDWEQRKKGQNARKRLAVQEQETEKRRESR